MKIIIGAWQKDQACPVEYQNITVFYENDSDDYLNVIPAGCTRLQKVVVKVAYMRKLRTSYPDFDGFYEAIEDQDTEEGDEALYKESIKAHERMLITPDGRSIAEIREEFFTEPLTICSNCEHTFLQHKDGIHNCLKCDCTEMRFGGRYIGDCL